MGLKMMGASHMHEYEVNIKMIREALDQIDDEIVRLLLNRFMLTDEVGKLKAKYNMPIFDQKREKNLLDKVDATVLNILEYKTVDEKESLQKSIRDIYEVILSCSKTSQGRIQDKL